MLDSLIGLMAALTLGYPAHAAPVVYPLPIAKPVVRQAAPVKKHAETLGVETSGQAAFAADVATGNVLYAKNPHGVLPIASLTKLMTAMVILDARLDPSQTLTFQADDFDGESKAVFAVGDTITRREAFEALLVGSVNAAGNALARDSLGRQAFVVAMNEKASALRLSSATFVEPTGIDTGNRASAADVAAMLTAALKYPEIRGAAALASVTVKTVEGREYVVKTTNQLLGTYLNKKPYRIVGAKTGSLPHAGYSMAQVTSDGAKHEIVVVSLGSDNHFSRYQDVKVLTTWVFENWSW